MSHIPTPIPDGAAAALRLRAVLTGHEMSGWYVESDDDDSAYAGIRQSECAACDYYVWANDAGHIIVAGGLQVVPPFTIPECPNPLIVAEDVRLRLLGQPELFGAATGRRPGPSFPRGGE